MKRKRTTYSYREDEHKFVTALRTLLDDRSAWMRLGNEPAHWLTENSSILARTSGAMGAWPADDGLSAHCGKTIRIVLMREPSPRTRLCKRCVDKYVAEVSPPEPPMPKRRRRRRA